MLLLSHHLLSGPGPGTGTAEVGFPNQRDVQPLQKTNSLLHQLQTRTRPSFTHHRGSNGLQNVCVLPSVTTKPRWCVRLTCVEHGGKEPSGRTQGKPSFTLILFISSKPQILISFTFTAWTCDFQHLALLCGCSPARGGCPGSVLSSSHHEAEANTTASEKSRHCSRVNGSFQVGVLQD